MPRPDHSIVALRIFGDDLDPDDVTALLGGKPDRAYRKGQRLVGEKTGQVRMARTGTWTMSAEDRKPEDIESQIQEILRSLTQDQAKWDLVRSRYRIDRLDMFCGVFMASANDGLEFSAQTMLDLGRRGISLGLDVYDAIDEEGQVEP